jgi:hypothetical protein
MDVFLVVGLSAGLFLALELRLARRAEPGVTDTPAVESVLFSAAFLRRRLAALTEELDRLDHDPDVFARAFHTKAARAAHDALMAEVSRLADVPRPEVGAVVEAETALRPRDAREVLDL